MDNISQSTRCCILLLLSVTMTEIKETWIFQIKPPQVIHAVGPTITLGPCHMKECLKPGVNIYSCSTCKWVVYCSSEHRQADSREHALFFCDLHQNWWYNVMCMQSLDMDAFKLVMTHFKEKRLNMQQKRDDCQYRPVESLIHHVCESDNSLSTKMDMLQILIDHGQLDVVEGLYSSDACIHFYSLVMALSQGRIQLCPQSLQFIKDIRHLVQEKDFMSVCASLVNNNVGCLDMLLPRQKRSFRTVMMEEGSVTKRLLAESLAELNKQRCTALTSVLIECKLPSLLIQQVICPYDEIQ